MTLKSAILMYPGEVSRLGECFYEFLISFSLIAFLSFSLLKLSPVFYSLFISAMMMLVETKLGDVTDFWIWKKIYKTAKEV